MEEKRVPRDSRRRSASRDRAQQRRKTVPGRLDFEGDADDSRPESHRAARHSIAGPSAESGPVVRDPSEVAAAVAVKEGPTEEPTAEPSLSTMKTGSPVRDLESAAPSSSFSGRYPNVPADEFLVSPTSAMMAGSARKRRSSIRRHSRADGAIDGGADGGSAGPEVGSGSVTSVPVPTAASGDRLGPDVVASSMPVGAQQSPRLSRSQHTNVLMTQPFLDESDTFAAALYKPHTVSVLLIIALLLVFFSAIRSYGSTSDNVVSGLGFAVLVFLVYCGTHLKDGIMMRPHPVFWRLVYGITIAYLVLLTFVLFQNLDDVREWMKYLDPRLGVPLADREYANDCTLFPHDDPMANLRGAFDEFVIAHTVGLAMKAVLLRDSMLCWALSIIFELLEITFQHQLANFRECWWDHLIYDVLGCNALGIFIGMKICKYFEMRDYRWIRIDQLQTRKSKLKRTLTQFSPFAWTKYNWNIFSSHKRFFGSFLLLVTVNSYDLTIFFLKNLLWIPPTNPMITFRLFLAWIINFSAVAEFYQYINDPKTDKMGTSTWLVLLAVTLEGLIIFKWAPGQLRGVMPPNIYYPWVAFAILFGLWYLLHFWVLDFYKYLHPKTSKDAIRTDQHASKKFAFLDILYYFSFAPLVFLFFSGCPHVEFGMNWFNDYFAYPNTTASAMAATLDQPVLTNATNYLGL